MNEFFMPEDCKPILDKIFSEKIMVAYEKLGTTFTSGDLARMAPCPLSSGKFYVNKMVKFCLLSKVPLKRLYQKPQIKKNCRDILELVFSKEVIDAYEKIAFFFTSGNLARMVPCSESSAKFYINKMIKFDLVTKIPNQRCYKKSFGKCPICENPKKEEINNALKSKVPIDQIIIEFNLNRKLLKMHARNCLSLIEFAATGALRKNKKITRYPRRWFKNISEEEKERIVSDYKGGISSVEIREQYKISLHNFYRILMEKNVLSENNGSTRLERHRSKYYFMREKLEEEHPNDTFIDNIEAPIADGFRIDWANKKVIALESETTNAGVTKKIDNYKKVNYNNLDGLYIEGRTVKIFEPNPKRNKKLSLIELSEKIINKVYEEASKEDNNP